MEEPLPELPEVETVRRGLEPVLVGHVITHADVRRPDLRWPFPPGLADRLTGARDRGARAPLEVPAGARSTAARR